MENISLRLSKLSKLYCKYYFNKFSLDQLIFSITYKCNFSCKTCFYADVMDKCTANMVKELDIGEVVKISASIGKFDKLLISGGEPFLRDDLPEICEVFYLQNKVKNIIVPTNGFDSEKICKYTSKILRKCPKISLDVGLSLDGLRESHDSIKRVKGSFDKTVETTRCLSFLKKSFSNLHVNILTVVNNVNLNEIADLSEFIKVHLPVDGHGLSPMRTPSRDKTIAPPSYKEWNKVSEKLTKYYCYWDKKRTKNKLNFFLATNKISYLHKIYAYVLEGKRLPFRCQAGNVIGVLDPNGDIKLCELTKAIGNIRSTNYNFKALWFSREANNMRKMVKGCSCTQGCFLAPSIEMNPVSLINALLLGRHF